LLKCIIVEDETLAQDVIKSHITRIGRMELVGVYRTAPEAKDALDRRDVDVLFLDIRLPGMSGLHFLRTLSNPPLVILTTAYAEYALESYEFNVIDYLLKPISYERFARAVNKILDGRLYSFTATGDPAAMPMTGPQGDHIFVKSNSKFFRVDFSEILYVQGMKDYLKIVTPDFTLVTHQTMNEMEAALPPRQFIRVHRSWLVAVRHIRAIYGNSIELGKLTIPIGTNYKTTVMELIGKK
jgi:DNA-binding LytR/AlgR family response regulator